jgi:hypothetical protein
LSDNSNLLETTGLPRKVQVQTTSLNKKGLEAYIKGLGTVLNLTNYAQIIINMARNLLIFTHLIYNIFLTQTTHKNNNSSQF